MKKRNKSIFNALLFHVSLWLFSSIGFSTIAHADAWLNNDANAIWQRSPGVYKEGSYWYVIFHAAPGDTNVKIYGDFTTSAGVALTRTPDGKFWWLKALDSAFARAPAHGDKYRFSLTRGGKTETFQDPAARWVTSSDLGSGWSRINKSSYV